MNLTVRSTAAATEYSGELMVVQETLPSGRQVTFDLAGPHLVFSTVITTPTVNWAGLGATNLEDTIAFAEALATVAVMAHSLGSSGEAIKQGIIQAQANAPRIPKGV